MIASQIINEIFACYEARGHRQYGEEVTELQHALQCAMWAYRADEPTYIVAACLLHDYGHLLYECDEDPADHSEDKCHEELGANYLAQFFNPEVVEPIRLHVAAKRYWYWRQPKYFEGLSPASQHSLQLQGGAMTAAEADEFICNPYAYTAIRLRRYDDASKVKNLLTPPLENYRALLEVLVHL